MLSIVCQRNGIAMEFFIYKYITFWNNLNSCRVQIVCMSFRFRLVHFVRPIRCVFFISVQFGSTKCILFDRRAMD